MAVAYVTSSASSAGVAFPLPGLAVGDVMVARLFTHVGSGGAWTDTSGWTAVAGQSGTAAAVHCDTYLRVADATDVAAAAVTFPGTASGTIGTVAAYRGVGSAEYSAYDFDTWAYGDSGAIPDFIPSMSGINGGIVCAAACFGPVSSSSPDFGSDVATESGGYSGTGLHAYAGHAAITSDGMTPEYDGSLGTSVDPGFGYVRQAIALIPVPTPPVVTGSIANPFGGPPPWDPGVSFTATSTGSDLASWSVDFGDGSAPVTGSWSAGTTSATIDLTGSFAYSAVGTYTVHVTATATDGSSTTVSLGTVVVNAYAIQSAAGAEGTNTSARGVITHRPIAEAHHFDRHLELSRFYDLDPTLYPPSPIPQHSLSIDVAPYVVATLPMDKPRCGAMSTSVAKARHWAMATDLGAELALGSLGAAARWLPFAGDMVPDSTLSPAGVRWEPHFGAAPWTPGRTFYERGGRPYIDADYSYYASGQRLKHTQAMVHDGTGWFLLDAGVSVSAFTWVMVAVLHHPETRHDYDILCTFQPGADPARARACNLRYEKGEIRSYLNARLSSTRLNAPVYKGRIRPTILVWGEENRHGTLGVVDALGKHWHEYAHPAHGNFPIENFKLGTNPVVGANKYAAIMDVLELSYFTTRLTPAQAAPVVHRLDHVYGVTGR